MSDGDLPDLPPDVASLLRDARDTPPAPAPERRKVAARLALTTGLAIPGASLAGVKLLSGASLARAVGLAVAVATAGGVAVGTLRPAPAPPHARAAPRTPPAPAPRVAPPPVVARRPQRLPSRRLRRRAVARRAVAHAARPPRWQTTRSTPSSHCSRRPTPPSRAATRLGGGRLARHARRFPRGRLAPEREALRVECLAARGERAAAEAARTAFHRRFPGSVLGAAVDRAAGDAP
ncbi:MAG: hypothetical protein U0324_04795 [Polyangiales bacterium]